MVRTFSDLARKPTLQEQKQANLLPDLTLTLSLSTRMRRRKDPYSHRVVEKGERQSHWRTVPYPRTSSRAPLSSATLDAVNEALASALHAQPKLKLSHPLSKANKRAFAVGLADIAVFHVFLSWRAADDGKEHAVFQRITAFAAGESVREIVRSSFLRL